MNGQLTHISRPYIERRGRQWLMTGLCNIDPYAHPVLGCDTMMQRFDYADPHYDYAERQFLGYGATTTHDINTETTPHATYRKVVRRYNNTDFVEHGKLTYEGLSDAENNLFHEYEIGTWYVDSTFTLADNLCADASIRIGKEVHYTRYYEGVEDRIVTAKRYEYDKYHNVREYVNMGDSVLADDDLRATIEYDSTNIKTYNLVSSPAKMVVYSNGTPTREIQVAYQKGQPIEVRRTDLLNTRTDTTNYHYDTFGLPDSVAFPANYKGERAFTTVQYDAYSHTLPVRVADQWGRTQQMRYDKFLQLPYYVTDPSGNKIEYKYDELGRLVSLSSSLGNVKYDYVPLNNNLSYIDVSMHGGSGKIFHRTFCDARGDMVQRFDKRGSRFVVSNRTTRDCFGRAITTYANVWADSLVRTYHTHNLDLITQTDYDVMDRPVSMSWADGVISDTWYEIGYDAFGHKRLLQNRADENGNEWQQYTSPQGWLTTSIAPDGATTSFKYDPLGQLLQSTDPDGLTTTHTYDGFGRRTKRVHPDAGTTRWTYDAAGNMIASATNLQLNRGEQTAYEYDYTRLVHVHYPQYPQNDVYYTYDSVGRLAMVQDVTGTERMEYDAMGNVSLSERTIVIPTELTAYRFTTHFYYDAFGCMLQIVYPDGETVSYNYSNGLLTSVDGDASVLYIQSIDYDEYDAPIHIQYGNGLTSDIAYDDVRRWIVARSLRDENNDYLQDISYHYDNVGNITQIEQDAPPYDNMGGEYMVTYTYDNQYRLIDAAQRNSSIRGDYDYTMAYSPSGVVDTKYCPETGTDITFGYTQGYNNSAFYTHQPQMAYSSTEEDIVMFRWDWNGQLTHIGRPYTEQFRRHVWNEAGQLAAAFGNEYCGYYAYDANGNRAYKLTGSVVVDQYNGGYIYASAYFDDATMYVNPYMVVTRRGYTKHYYNGSQRIASRLGDYWGDGNTMVRNDDLIALLDTTKSLWNDITYVWEPSHQDMQDDAQFIDVAGNSLPIHRYGPYIGEIGSHLYDADIFSYVFWGDFHITDDTGGDGVFFYHSDHLGSANWITNSRGQAVQYLHYMPFGELWENQQAFEYDERFKFTGKERDAETGYDYFGARYYLSLLGIWLSPDPLLDKYPSISSYAYCGWNPLKRIDFDGREWKDIEGNIIKDHTDIKAYIYYDPKSFEGQSLQMYKDAVSLYGEGSVALSDVTTQGEFVTDWKNMASPDIQEINVNYHGNNQTIMLNSSEGQYITATGNGLSNVSNTPAFNVQDLPNPIGNVMNAQLNLNTCRSNNHSQHPLAGSGLTLAEAFRSKFNFNIVRGTHAGVSYNRFTKHPEPQHFWQKWDYLYRPYPSQSPRVGLPPR